MPQLEDQYLIDNQLRATYQNTRLKQNVQLDISCTPKTARLTKIMITLGKEIVVHRCCVRIKNTIEILL